ncbi:MAG: phage terminase large subunit [Bacteroidales bacterium]|nr:phage terminase large subunit [Bacteroidales bacterium]
MASKIDTYIRDRLQAGKSTFVFRGGRRSGKTFGILKFLMLWSEGFPGTVCNIASMTSEQGRLGAYADAKTIKDLAPAVYGDIEVLSSPREFRMANGSRMHFNQYSNSETAKGIACDWLFVNEANNFSKQQYTDLKANARLGTFIDYNPNCEFWDVDFFTDADICDTTWQDNPYLTAAQLEYFADLKRLAESPTATEIDRRNYSVYYLGRYYQLNGDIFSEDFFNWSQSVDFGSIGHFAIFCDPSALRGSDWFACCLSARDNAGRVYILDTYSVNTGDRAGIVRKLCEWCKTYDVAKVYVETNGIIGIDFYDFAVNSKLNVEGWYSRGGKFDRIIANYQNFRERMTILDTPANREYMKQTYSFAERMKIGEHDDNIDALNSSYNMQTMVV